MNPVAFQFTEDMRGFASAGQTSFDDGYAAGRDSNSPLMFHLTLKTDDLPWDRWNQLQRRLSR